MHCPFCSAEETKVIDSRLVAEGHQVRRRRECAECHERFTTFESAELVMPRVIKRDGTREPFNEDKLRAGLQRALEKRPVSTEKNRAVCAATQINIAGNRRAGSRKRIIGQSHYGCLKGAGQSGLRSFCLGVSFF